MTRIEIMMFREAVTHRLFPLFQISWMGAVIAFLDNAQNRDACSGQIPRSIGMADISRPLAEP